MANLGGPISRDFVEKVRDAADIVRIVTDYVPLKQAGSRLKGLCPFHQEKTPSFTVDPERKLFFCFGCQTGGDLFKFVMLYENVEFPDAVKSVASSCGIPIPKPGRRSGESDGRDAVFRALDAADRFFRGQLREDAGRKCREYVERRRIGPEIAERLSLGCALDSWDALRIHMLARGFGPSDLVRAGLAVPRKDGSGEYDRFRNRLIFPIREIGGRTVAFGGRALGEGDEPKYVNSPETPAYVKGEHLYGLDLARESIRREGFAVVVEGYLDLAAVLSAGLENVVASLGTAFTPAQARLLGRYTRRVVFSYDGDAAGSSAAVRSLDLLLERGFEVRVVDLPGGMDPDDYIREEGAEAYGRLVRQAPGYLDYIVQKEARSRDLTRVEETVEAVNAVLPHLARLSSPIERVSWAGRLADALGVDEDLVHQELRGALKSGSGSIRRPGTGRTEGPRQSEARFVSLLLQFPDARRQARERLETEDLTGSKISGIVRTLLRLPEEGAVVDSTRLLDALDDEAERDLLTRILFRDEPEGRPEEVDDCLRAFRRVRLQREHRELRRVIERTADAAALDSLLVRTQQLARQIDALS